MATLENRIKRVEEDIAAIRDRNKRVEVDKAWETSIFRTITLGVITYLLASLVMYSLGTRDYFFAATIPTLGFLISTQSLPLVKRWWIRKQSRK